MSNTNTNTNTIKLICVGGYGDFIVKNLADEIKQTKNDLEILSVNTDIQSQSDLPADRFIHLATMGAGGNPEQGYNLARNHEAEIETALADTDLAILVAGLGKGTGSGAGYFLAEKLNQLNIPTVALLRLPESDDSAYRQNIATDYLNKIKSQVMGYLTVSNDTVLNCADRLAISTLEEAYSLGNRAYSDSLLSLIALVDHVGIRNTDLEDFKATVRGQFTVNSWDTQDGNLDVDLSLFDLDPKIARTSLTVIETPEKGNEAVNQLRASMSARRLIQASLNPDINNISGVLTNPQLTDAIRVILVTSGYEKTLSEIRAEAGRKGLESRYMLANASKPEDTGKAI